MMQKKLCVLGSINVDIVIRVSALPLPGETVQGGDLGVLLGGKGANQAVAGAQAGGSVSMFGVTGHQSFGLDIPALMSGYGVDIRSMRTVDGPTGTAIIAVDADGENAIAISPGANGRLAEVVLAPPPASSILLAQMETPPDITADWFRAGKSSNCTTILNAAPALPMPDGLLTATDILIVNETEFASYTGIDLPTSPTKDDIVAAADHLIRKPDQAIIVTMGKAGAYAVLPDRSFHLPARQVEVRDTTGAGDCFCGAMAARLADGATLDDALRFATAAAALSIGRDGAAPSMPQKSEIEALVE